MRGRAHPLATVPPWLLGVLCSTPLAVAYLPIRPPAADLAAATYRSDLFTRNGFQLWDNGWYGGHHLPGYSLFAPALGALLTPRGCLAISAVLAAGLFGALARRGFAPVAAQAATAWFAIGFGVELVSGRMPYDLGVAVGLAALLALAGALRFSSSDAGGAGARGRSMPTRSPLTRSALRRPVPPSRVLTAVALVLAALTGLTSPVAGAFLALAGVAIALATAAHGRGVAFAAAALIPVLLLQLAFSEGGYEPFAASAFWPALAGTLLVMVLLAREGQRLLAVGAGLYALALVASYATHTAMGGNAARLGPLVAGPLLVGVLWQRRALLLAVLTPLLLYWSVVTPVRDLVDLVGDPSVHAAYYAPLLDELQSRSGARPLRVEIPLTAAHWESDYVAARFSLARGWERQLDTHYAAPFYAPLLTPAAYLAWLRDNGVDYVALPDVPLDHAGQAEGRLIAGGLPYLVPLWRSIHWRLYAVRGATPLASAPATLTSLRSDGFSLSLSRAATALVRVRYTPYWAILSGRGCVGPAPGGWTAVSTSAPEQVVVGIRFALGRIRATRSRCVE